MNHLFLASRRFSGLRLVLLRPHWSLRSKSTNFFMIYYHLRLKQLSVTISRSVKVNFEVTMWWHVLCICFICFTHYFISQVAAKRRSRRFLTETDEYVSNNNEGNLMDNVSSSTAYQRMKTLCINFRTEIFADIQILNQNILPRY